MAMDDDDALTPLELAERLKLISIRRATSMSGDDRGYSRIRARFMENAATRERLPSCIRTCQSLEELFRFLQSKFASYGERRAFLGEQFQSLLEYLESRERGDSPVAQSEALVKIDDGFIRQSWTKALARLPSDSDGAVTAARTLLETVCKQILDEAGKTYGSQDDLPSLYSQAAEVLSISPSQQVDEAIRRMMGAAQQVVERVGGLRNLLGDAHGKGQTSPATEVLYAELAVNMAGSMSSFLIGTWQNDRAARTSESR